MRVCAPSVMSGAALGTFADKGKVEPNPKNIMNRFTLKGDWNIAKGKLKQQWATLTDDDLQYIEGQGDELIGRIQKRTGETREAVEKALRDADH